MCIRDRVYAEKGESAFCLKGDLVTGCADAIAQLAENKLLRRQMGAHNRAAATAFSDKDRMMQLRAYYQEALAEYGNTAQRLCGIAVTFRGVSA